MVRVAVAYGGGERFYLGHAGDPDEGGRVVVIYDDGEEGLAEGSWVTGVAPAVAGSVGIGRRWKDVPAGRIENTATEDSARQSKRRCT